MQLTSLLPGEGGTACVETYPAYFLWASMQKEYLLAPLEVILGIPFKFRFNKKRMEMIISFFLSCMLKFPRCSTKLSISP